MMLHAEECTCSKAIMVDLTATHSPRESEGVTLYGMETRKVRAKNTLTVTTITLEVNTC